MAKGKLFVISGASGVGKTSILRRIMKARNDLYFSVSATTRPPRPAEQDGVNYHFVSHDCFQEMILHDAFLEYDDHMGNLYGTPKAEVTDNIDKSHVILDVEPIGAFRVRELWPEAVLIFIVPPSLEVLEERLRGRGDTSEEQISLRIRRAAWELEQSRFYNYIVVNDQLDDCVDQMLNIIAQEAD